ncbi:MAG: thioredoxin family protein [Euryarchaeota archaeon]|nr:thioredoxin family protein [Euryarchaeota archaeon]
MKRILILLLALSTLGCTGGSGSETGGNLGPSNSEADLQVALNTGRPVLLEFYAEWCTHCQDQAPIINEIKEQYRGKLIVIKIDVDQNPGLLEAMTGQLPTIILYDGTLGPDGHPNHVAFWIGYTEKSEILKAISTL